MFRSWTPSDQMDNKIVYETSFLYYYFKLYDICNFRPWTPCVPSDWLDNVTVYESSFYIIIWSYMTYII